MLDVCCSIVRPSHAAASSHFYRGPFPSPNHKNQFKKRCKPQIKPHGRSARNHSATSTSRPASSNSSHYQCSTTAAAMLLLLLLSLLLLSWVLPRCRWAAVITPSHRVFIFEGISTANGRPWNVPRCRCERLSHKNESIVLVSLVGVALFLLCSLFLSSPVLAPPPRCYNLVRSCTILYDLVRSCAILYDLVRSCTISYDLVRSCAILYDLVRSCTILG